MPTRRDAASLIAAALATGPLVRAAHAQERATTPNPQAPADDNYLSRMPEAWRAMMSRGEQAAMLLYPGLTALDLVGPQYAFGCTLGLKVHLVAKTRDPVMSDTKVERLPRDLTPQGFGESVALLSNIDLDENLYA